VSLKLEALGDWRRTHTCGELTRAHVKQTVTLMGWLHRSRDHGGVLFTDLRDRYGLTQVVFHPETGGKPLLERASRLGNEFVIAVRGVVMERPADAVNPELATGMIEVDARELKLLSASDPLPFQVNEEHMLASEDLRLKYPNLVDYESKVLFRSFYTPEPLPEAGAVVDSVEVKRSWLGGVKKAPVRRQFSRSSEESAARRRGLQIGIDLMLALLSWTLAYLVRFNFDLNAAAVYVAPVAIGIFVIVQVAMLATAGGSPLRPRRPVPRR